MKALLNDPALLVGLIRALMILVVSFGAAITNDQQAAILEFVGVLIAVLSILLTGVTRALTTPVSAPSLPQGTTVDVVTPEGEPNTSVTL